MTTPIESAWLELSVAALAQGRPVPAAAARWLADGLVAYKAGVPLERALGLSGQRGERTVRDHARRASRDAALRTAWTAMPSPVEDWSRAAALGAALRREPGLPPPRAADHFRLALRRALAAGAHIPTSAQQLIKICRDELN